MKIYNRLKKKFHSLVDRKTPCDYTLYQYQDKHGKFDYSRYVSVQTEGNKKKIDKSWVSKDEINFLANEIKKRIPNVKSGVCHGTRQGLEQSWFSEKLNVDVIGTEISDTATDFPNTIQWDFHEQNPEWVESFDFVYSNSFDHAYDPKRALDNWINTLNKNGICILEHSEAHTPEVVKELDPFGVSLEYFPYLILTWSGGRYSVREILKFGTKSYLLIKRQ